MNREHPFSELHQQDLRRRQHAFEEEHERAQATSRNGGMPNVLPENNVRDVSDLSDAPRADGPLPRKENKKQTNWFPLSRQALDHLIAQPDTLKVYCHLSAASLKTGKERFFYSGYCLEEAQAGTAIFKLSKLAASASVPLWSLKNILTNLSSAGFLDCLDLDGETTGKPSFADWDLYQGWEDDTSRDDIAICHLAPLQGGWLRIQKDTLSLRPDELRLLLWAISKMRNNAKAITRVFKGKSYTVKQCSFIASYEDAAEALILNRFQTRRFAQKLKRLGFLSEIPATNSYLWRVSQNS